MNKKKLASWVFLTSLVLLLTFSLVTPSVFAQDEAALSPNPPIPASTTAPPVSIFKVNCADIKTGDYEYMQRVYCVWLGGMSMGKDFNFVGEIAKWMFLLLIILLIYSSLAFASFPESAAIRLVLSIVGGILATILLTPAELVTALQSYSALGMALTLFFPILILGFFTLVVATKANPIGILLQKIMWIIYSVYLFIKAGTFYVLMTSCGDKAGTIASTQIGDTTCGGFFFSIVKAITSDSSLADYVKNMGNFDSATLLLLIIVAVAVFVIAVATNDFMVHWLAREKMVGDIEAQKDTLARAQALRKIEAEATKKT